MKKTVLYLIILCIYIFVSCSSGNKDKDRLVSMEFNYDSTRVELPIKLFNTDYEISPPRNMVLINSRITSWSRIIDFFPFTIDSTNCKVFANQRNNSMFLTTISHVSSQLRYEDILKATNLNLNSETKFKKDDLLIKQFVYSDSKNILIIFIHPQNEFNIELYFLIPLNVYNSYSRNIESAMSSFKKIRRL